LRLCHRHGRTAVGIHRWHAQERLLGAGNSSAMSFTPSAATLTAGGTAVLWMGGSNEIATAAPGVSVMHYDFDGKIIVPPGNLVFIGGSVAQTGLFTMSSPGPKSISDRRPSWQSLLRPRHWRRGLETSSSI
jgi:hypothetical protein